MPCSVAARRRSLLKQLNLIQSSSAATMHRSTLQIQYTYVGLWGQSERRELSPSRHEPRIKRFDRQNKAKGANRGVRIWLYIVKNLRPTFPRPNLPSFCLDEMTSSSLVSATPRGSISSSIGSTAKHVSLLPSESAFTRNSLPASELLKRILSRTTCQPLRLTPIVKAVTLIVV